MLKYLFLLLLLVTSTCFSQNEMGQTIQINTRFNKIIGRPSWLIIIRDVDHDQNVPYLFDLTQNENFFVMFTQGRHYSILTSRLQFDPYHRYPYFTSRRISNFCHLESNGHIYKNVSMTVNVTGDLTSNPDRYTCHVSRYTDDNFTVVKPESDSSE